MLSVEWDLSELGVRRGRGTGIVVVLIYNTRNEELATQDCRSFQRFNPAQRFRPINTQGVSNYITDIYEQKPKTLAYAPLFIDSLLVPVKKRS